MRRGNSELIQEPAVAADPDRPEAVLRADQWARLVLADPEELPNARPSHAGRENDPATGPVNAGAEAAELGENDPGRHPGAFDWRNGEPHLSAGDPSGDSAREEDPAESSAEAEEEDG